MATILPTNIFDIQLDYLIVPMDNKIYQKFIKKLKPLNLLLMEIQELMLQLQNLIKTKARCVIFVRPHQVIQIPDIYRQALTVFQQMQYPHIEISEQVFEYLIIKCDQLQLSQSTYTSQLQGIPQELISNLTLMSGYANNSSQQNGFGNSIYQIKQTYSEPQQSNQHIATFIFMYHDFQHYFAAQYSEQMKSEQSLNMSQIVPITMYNGQKHSDSYAPIQYIPPLCDDPTNPHFYCNDCRPAVAYNQPIKNLPIPRLLLRTEQLLSLNDSIVAKEDTIIKSCQEMASLYYQKEHNLGISCYLLCKLISEKIQQCQVVNKQLNDLVLQVKSNPQQHQHSLCSMSASNPQSPQQFQCSQYSNQETSLSHHDSIQQQQHHIRQISNINQQQYATQQINLFQMKSNPKTVEVFSIQCLNRYINIFTNFLTIKQQLNEQQQNSIKNIIFNLSHQFVENNNQTKIITQIQKFVTQYIGQLISNQINETIVIDFDQYDLIVQQQLKWNLFVLIFSRFFNTNNNQFENDIIKHQYQYNKQLQIDLESLHYIYLNNQKEVLSNFNFKKISMTDQSINTTVQVYDQSIFQVVHCCNKEFSQVQLVELIHIYHDDIQIKLNDQIYTFQHEQLNTTSYQLTQIVAQFIQINKYLKSKQKIQQTLNHSQNAMSSNNDTTLLESSLNKQFNEYYVPLTQNTILEQQENLQEQNDDDQMTKTNREKYKCERVAEDTTKGKCNVCPLVYNNYKEHCRSQVHRNKYFESLEQEKLMEPLQKLTKKTELKNQILTTLSTLCYFISARQKTPYQTVAEEMNFVLKNMDSSLKIDIYDAPRPNSPTCRTEAFRSWRENMIKQKMQQFEQIMNLQNEQQDLLINNKYLDQIRTTLAYSQFNQEAASRILTLRKVLQETLSQFNYQFQKQDVPDQNTLYNINEIPPNACINTGIQEFVDDEDLFSKLALINLQMNSNTHDNTIQQKNTNTYNSNTFSSFDQSQFLLQQEYVQIKLQQLYSQKIILDEYPFFNYFVQNYHSQMSNNEKQLNQQQLQYNQEHKFIQQLRYELENVEIGKQNTKNQKLIMSDLINKILQNNNKIVKYDILKQNKELIKKIIRNNLILPNVYKKQSKTVQTNNEMLQLVFDEVSINKEDILNININTDINQVIQDIYEHKQDFIVIDQVCNFQKIKFNVTDTQDDIAIKYSSENQIRVYHYQSLRRRSNSIVSIDYPLLQSDQISMQILKQDNQCQRNKLLFDNYKDLQKQFQIQQQTEQSEETFTDYSHTKIASQQQLQQYEVTEQGSVFCNILRGFDFNGQYVDMKNINLNILNSTCAIVSAFIYPTFLIGPIVNLYDDFIFSILGQNGIQGIDSAKLALISQCTANNIKVRQVNKQYDCYVPLNTNRSTIERRLVKQGVFEIVKDENEKHD